MYYTMLAVMEITKSIQQLIHVDCAGHGVNSMLNHNGEKFYEACLKYFTSLSDVNPKDLQIFGYKSLEKSQARFIELAVQLGYVNNSANFREAVNAVTSDKNLYFDTEEQVIEAYKEAIGMLFLTKNYFFHVKIQIFWQISYRRIHIYLLNKVWPN